MKNRITELKKAIFEYYFKLVFSHETIKIYELRRELNSHAFRVFSFLCNKGLDEMCMTQAQVLGFCQEFPKQLNKNSTFALLRMELDFYVADLTSIKEGRFVSAHTLDTSSVDSKKQKIIVLNT